MVCVCVVCDKTKKNGWAASQLVCVCRAIEVSVKVRVRFEQQLLL